MGSFLLQCGFSLTATSRGYSSLQHMGSSLMVVPLAEEYLVCVDSIVVVHGLSVCGIFWDRD